MGCAGSIQDTVSYDKSNKRNAFLSHLKFMRKQQVIDVKACSINIGQYFSPFQFYEKSYENASDKQKQESQQFQLNKTFDELDKYYDQMKENIFTKQKRRKIVKLHQLTIRKIKRYTPIYNTFFEQQSITKQLKQNNEAADKKVKIKGTVGIKMMNNMPTLMDQNQYRQVWIKKFNQLLKSPTPQAKDFRQFVHRLQIDKNPQLNKKQIMKWLLNYDVRCYHSLLQYVYKREMKKIDEQEEETRKLQQAKTIKEPVPQFTASIVNTQLKQFIKQKNDKQKNDKSTIRQKRISKIVKNNLIYKYKLFLQKKYEHNSLKIDVKLGKIAWFAAQNKLNVIFMQQVSDQSLAKIREYLGNYRIILKNSTAILIQQNLASKISNNSKNMTLQNINENVVVDEKTRKKLGSLLTPRKQEIVIKQIYAQQDTNLKSDHIESTINKINENVISRFKQQIHFQQIQHRQLPLNSQIDSKNNYQTMKQMNVKQTGKQMLNFGHYLNYQHKIDKKMKQIKYRNPDKQQVRFGSDSTVQFLGNVILISIYLKKSQNYTVKNLKQDLIYYRKNFVNHTIIAGINVVSSKYSTHKLRDQMKPFRNLQQDDDDEDQNSASQQNYQNINKFYFSPNIYDVVPGIFDDQKCVVDNEKLRKLAQRKGFFTSRAKRTRFYLGLQQDQGQAISVNNFIISTNVLKKNQINQANGTAINSRSQFFKNQQYLPNKQHPFANFFVKCDLKIKVQAQIQQKQYGQQQQKINDNIIDEREEFDNQSMISSQDG